MKSGKEIERMAYTVEVIRSSRRSLALQIRPDGTVLVRAPKRTSGTVIRAFVMQHRDWIEKQLHKLGDAPSVEKLTAEELEALREQAKLRLPQRAAYFAPLLGVSYGRITVRCQKTKWGSCSSQGNLNFNLLLMLAPQEVQDYVVVHELCHRLEMNHSARFWQAVEQILPDYGERRRWLREHGSALMARAI